MFCVRCLLMFAVCYLVGGTAAGADGPLELIRAHQLRYLQIISDPKFHSKDKEKELNEILTEHAMALLDVREMVKRALSAHWARMTTGEQNEFVDTFRRYMEVSNRLPGRFRSTDLRLETETIEANLAEVRGYFYFPAGRNAPAVYKLHLVDGRWKLYDYSAWGVEDVKNLRAQFDRVIRKSSIKGLVDLLNEKQTFLEKSWANRE